MKKLAIVRSGCANKKLVGSKEGGTKHVIACTPAPCILNVNFCPYPYKHQFGFGILNMVGPKKQDQKSTISKETIVFAGDSLSKSSNHTFKVNFLCQKSTDSKTFFLPTSTFELICFLNSCSIFDKQTLIVITKYDLWPE